MTTQDAAPQVTEVMRDMAPELLAAVKELSRFYEGTDSSLGIMACAVIAKAEGRAP